MNGNGSLARSRRTWVLPDEPIKGARDEMVISVVVACIPCTALTPVESIVDGNRRRLLPGLEKANSLYERPVEAQPLLATGCPVQYTSAIPA